MQRTVFRTLAQKLRKNTILHAVNSLTVGLKLHKDSNEAIKYTPYGKEMGGESFTHLTWTNPVLQ